MFERWTALGVLPYPGPMGSQPAFIVEAFSLCAQARETMQEVREARARREDRQSILAILGARKGPDGS